MKLKKSESKILKEIYQTIRYTISESLEDTITPDSIDYAVTNAIEKAFEVLLANMLIEVDEDTNT